MYDVKRKKIIKLKRELGGKLFTVTTETSGVVAGMLASSSMEKRIKKHKPLPFDINEDDYICIINTSTGIASFLLIDDIKTIAPVK